MVELQSRLKQSAVAVMKEMDVSFTARIDEICAARHAVMSDVSTTRRLLDDLRTNAELDQVNSESTLESLSSSLASIPPVPKLLLLLLLNVISA